VVNLEGAMLEWFTGSGVPITFDDIMKKVENHIKNDGTVFIGTDSQIIKDECIFSSAICLHGANNQQGGSYFFKRSNFKIFKFLSLIERITVEVEKSINIANKVSKRYPDAKIEIHLDISASNKKEKTSKFADMLIGYAKGVGFDCKIKPDAFAATSIADKHTK
tara:strand:- start:658 stop:1149 length:492 start_codon:yes stop_codon:yes gene_type:complete